MEGFCAPSCGDSAEGFPPVPAVRLFTVCWAGSKGTKLLWEVKLPLHQFNQEKFLLPWFSS